MIIREMKLEDTKDVLNMMKVFYDSPAVLHKASDNILKQDIADCVGNSPFIEGFIFENENNIAGYSMIVKSYSTEYGGPCIWIEDLYIKPEYRSLGMGTKFFNYIENKFKDTAVRFRLEVESSNEKAISVYKKCGYNELPYIEMTKEI